MVIVIDIVADCGDTPSPSALIVSVAVVGTAPLAIVNLSATRVVPGGTGLGAICSVTPAGTPVTVSVTGLSKLLRPMVTSTESLTPWLRVTDGCATLSEMELGRFSVGESPQLDDSNARRKAIATLGRAAVRLMCAFGKRGARNVIAAFLGLPT
jgi:hypothetical protein